jgi:excisionase family DNA binding protein
MGSATQSLEPLAVSISDATRLLGIGRTRLYRAFSDGDLTPIKCGKKTLVAYSDLQDWLGRLRGGKPQQEAA